MGRPIVTGTAQSEIGPLTRVVLKYARDAFVDEQSIGGQWRALKFTAPPDFANAVREYDRFVELLRECGASVDFLPPAPGAGMDSIYVRDASVVCDRGVVLGRMGKALRQGEPAAQKAAFRSMEYPVIGAIEPPGCLEGGDAAWIDTRTLAVGRGYRTNDAGIAQLRALLGDSIDEMIVVPLPHWRGSDDVFHLMSMFSPVDRDLAVVYSPLLPVPFRERLLAEGITLVDVPDEEFERMATNVLAVAPRRCIMLSGNPLTRAKLERAGATVFEYEGYEISVKGGGGPTCLTRPLRRFNRQGI